MSMPPTGTQDLGPDSPFRPPLDPQPPPEDAYYQALEKFVISGRNREPDSTLTTLMDLSPDHLIHVCRTTLRASRDTRDLLVSISSNEVCYLPRGFQQELCFNFSTLKATDKTKWTSLTATFMQFENSDDALQAFTDYVGSFQTLWDTTLHKNSDVGDYAFQSDTSILWQRWTTVIILESNVDPDIDPSTAGSIDFVKFAGNLDLELTSMNGLLEDAHRAVVQSAVIPSVKVDETVKCTIAFEHGAHAVRSVELLDYGTVNLAGEIDANGQFWIIGQKAGTARLRIRVAHAQSLKVTETDPFTVTVKSGL